jgi:8-oxo-dGTP pyrophosphatase MutT (NUDIX family)
MTDRVDRPSARVIVVDETENVLLFRIVDALDAKPPVWITPGGGIEPGEPLAVAAARELREETGVVVAPDALGAPIAVCRGDWAFRGVPLYSVDWFFALRVPRFEPSDEGWEDLERELHASWRWWPADELDEAPEVILPSGLAQVVRRIFLGSVVSEPIELPWLAV